jgi:Coenzyme PQQ synthesis protein D (PqqD)
MSGFRPDPDVLTRRVGEEVVLVHMARNEIFALNRTGARLWELLSEGGTRAEAVEQLKTEFDASADTVEREADRFMALLEREGLAQLEEHP